LNEGAGRVTEKDVVVDGPRPFIPPFENCPVLQGNPPTRASRLALCDTVGRAVATGLDLLGIAHPERM
jgi:arginyl-tRNA synthetase